MLQHCHQMLGALTPCSYDMQHSRVTHPLLNVWCAWSGRLWDRPCSCRPHAPVCCGSSSTDVRRRDRLVHLPLHVHILIVGLRSSSTGMWRCVHCKVCAARRWRWAIGGSIAFIGVLVREQIFVDDMSLMHLVEMMVACRYGGRCIHTAGFQRSVLGIQPAAG